MRSYTAISISIHDLKDIHVEDRPGYRMTGVVVDDPDVRITVWDPAGARRLADALAEAADRLDAKLGVPA